MDRTTILFLIRSLFYMLVSPLKKQIRLSTAHNIIVKLLMLKQKHKDMNLSTNGWLDYYKNKNGYTQTASKYTTLGKRSIQKSPFWNTFELSMVGEEVPRIRYLLNMTKY